LVCVLENTIGRFKSVSQPKLLMLEWGYCAELESGADSRYLTADV